MINYAIYAARGEWIAQKLRSLWHAGCDVSIIYSVTTRPVLRSSATDPGGADPHEAVDHHGRASGRS